MPTWYQGQRDKPGVAANFAQTGVTLSALWPRYTDKGRSVVVTSYTKARPPKTIETMTHLCNNDHGQQALCLFSIRYCRNRASAIQAQNEAFLRNITRASHFCFFSLSLRLQSCASNLPRQNPTPHSNLLAIVLYRLRKLSPEFSTLLFQVKSEPR